MKIIYITFNGISEALGQSQVLPYLEGLSDRGIKFYLVSLEKNIKEAEGFSKRLAKSNIIWHKLPYIKFYKLGMVVNILQCFLTVLYLIIFKKIRIIHSRAYLPIFSIFIFKKIFGLKIIFDMRGFWPEELVDQKRIKANSFYYKLLKFFEKKSIFSADYIITLTPESKKIIENNYKNISPKVVWMPTCVDKEKFSERCTISFMGKFVMVYAGSLWSFYDMPSQIDFFKILKTKINNAHFLILGNNNPDKLKDVLRQKGVSEGDYTIISVKSQDVPKYVAGCGLGISFRYDFYSQKAAFPTKLAEYLICGFPVVINTPSEFIKNLVVVNKIGVVVDDFSDYSYQKTIEELVLLLKDPELKERCKKTAEKYLEKNVCVNEYLKIYYDILRKEN